MGTGYGSFVGSVQCKHSIVFLHNSGVLRKGRDLCYGKGIVEGNGHWAVFKHKVVVLCKGKYLYSTAAGQCVCKMQSCLLKRPVSRSKVSLAAKRKWRFDL